MSFSVCQIQDTPRQPKTVLSEVLYILPKTQEGAFFNVTYRQLRPVLTIEIATPKKELQN